MKIREEYLPLSRPSIGHAEIRAVIECLQSKWITTGPLCKDFEDRFVELTDAGFAVGVTSATAGMHIVLLGLGIGEGDEVITPSMTFASTVNMIARVGAKPVFVDVDYGTLNIRPEQIEARITEKTKAVVPVHFAGAPADMDPILAVADRHGLAVIEDAAHAVGTRYGGVHAGGFGRIAIFSFHPLKNITTAEGGMITLSDPELAKKIRGLRFHGIERDAWKRYGKGGNPDYDIREPGFKYNLPDLLAALGIGQLSRLLELNERRAQLAALYCEGLKGVEGIDLPEVPSYPHRHAWHLFVVKVTGMERDRFMERLSDCNIGYGLHFPPCHLLEFVRRRFGTAPGMLPETERAAGRILSLPFFPDMKDEDVAYVCEAVKEILHG
ncbi:MAG: UDP-4-amino-4-deoxy-L-arabinose--oxoglutarate aminotransferase [Syntrophaceae bacterium PtaU1.Bin231]|nr:MAG: UDP-4-amino-4-deoxy-L-arabinose--oxoglutarate aminotransferase [Syntrophaceae bacterium PtaU1.Bin231]HOG16537.1 DegT/DnrJ/EryC1/StrS family aminotransferase [Syntrophales bacterium]